MTLATAITFNSCEKIEEASPVTINNSKTASISGMIHAELMDDERVFKEALEGTNFGYEDTSEYAPVGTEIHFHVTKQDFNDDVEDANDEFRYSTTVNANGSYSFDIPTTEEGVNVDVSFDDFVYNFQSWEIDSYNVAIDSVYVNSSTSNIDTAFGDTTYFYSSRTERIKYTCDPFSIDVYENQNVIEDHDYDKN
jgi:hypothetical protein